MRHSKNPKCSENDAPYALDGKMAELVPVRLIFSQISASGGTINDGFRRIFLLSGRLAEIVNF
jgi:hypothetical protein